MKPAWTHLGVSRPGYWTSGQTSNIFNPVGAFLALRLSAKCPRPAPRRFVNHITTNHRDPPHLWAAASPLTFVLRRHPPPRELKRYHQGSVCVSTLPCKLIEVLGPSRQEQIKPKRSVTTIPHSQGVKSVMMPGPTLSRRWNWRILSNIRKVQSCWNPYLSVNAFTKVRT